MLPVGETIGQNEKKTEREGIGFGYASIHTHTGQKLHVCEFDITTFVQIRLTQEYSCLSMLYVRQ